MPLSPLLDSWGRPMHDPLTRRQLFICWSLLESPEDNETVLPEQSQRTRELVVQEEILWHGREKEPRWKQFLP